MQRSVFGFIILCLLGISFQFDLSKAAMDYSETTESKEVVEDSVWEGFVPVQRSSAPRVECRAIDLTRKPVRDPLLSLIPVIRKLSELLKFSFGR